MLHLMQVISLSLVELGDNHKHQNDSTNQNGFRFVNFRQLSKQESMSIVAQIIYDAFVVRRERRGSVIGVGFALFSGRSATMKTKYAEVSMSSWCSP